MSKTQTQIVKLEQTHLFECDCLICQDAISSNSKVEGRRIVIINEYGSLKKVTVAQNQRRRKRWLETEN